MGVAYDAICNSCNHRFRVFDGGTFITEQFRCSRCGRTKSVDRIKPCGEPMPLKHKKCRCGGTYTTTSPVRCPACRSTNLREADDPHRILFD
jgi:hypothetical protein